MKRLIVTEHFAVWTERFNQPSYNTFRVYCTKKCGEYNAKNNCIEDDDPILVIYDYTNDWADVLLKNSEGAKQGFWRVVECHNEHRYKYKHTTFVQIFPESAIDNAPDSFDYSFDIKQRHYIETKGKNNDIAEIVEYLRLSQKAIQKNNPRISRGDSADNSRQIQGANGWNADPVIVDGRFTERIEESIEMYNVAKTHTSEPCEAAIVEIDADVRKGLQKDITVPIVEKLDGLIAAVNNNTRNQERAVFNGAFRAQARFDPPIDEVSIEKVHRLRCDDVDWNYIGRTIYREENNQDIPEENLPSYVNALQKRYGRAYPDPTKKKRNRSRGNEKH